MAGPGGPANFSAMQQITMPTIGRAHRIEGHYLGDFVAEVLALDLDVARVRVIDPLRPAPPTRKTQCPYPFCILPDFHGGGHVGGDQVREGITLELYWRTGRWIPIDDDRFKAAKAPLRRPERHRPGRCIEKQGDKLNATTGVP